MAKKDLLNPSDIDKAIARIADGLPENAVNALEKLAKSPTIQTLIQFIPGVCPAFGVAVATTYDKIHEIRFRTFFDELGKGNITLTKQDVLNYEFLHAFINTVKYVLETRRRDKIKLFANLFTVYCQNNVLTKMQMIMKTFRKYLMT
ncbi:MAG: hypothetical protein ABSC87_08200 [Halobacteriota archaeon]|jgi:hypothetical protein